MVSIIVRTKDRPVLLKRAIASIARQTYRPIEVVLVNDGGCDIDVDELKRILGNVTLNYVGLQENTGRAHAANVGVENAHGDYIGFLDDDDEFYPDHVSILISSLKQSNFKVAYSAVEFIEKKFGNDNQGFISTRKTLFAEPFSYANLLIANYIPLMSLLFESNLLKSLMFDESFDLYEDWDMLIRAGEVTQFHFVNTVTAVYSQWGSSQIAFSSPSETIRQETLKLYAKHRLKMPLELVYEMREEKTRKEAVIAKKDAYIKELEVQVNNLKNALQEKESYIQFIQSGRGWRLLTKYYKIRDKILRRLH